MRRFNLSEWALHNRGLVLYAMIALAVIGTWSYLRLGQSEDPPFTFKAMVVRTLWPGATAEEVSLQVTERIEKAVMNTGKYEFVRSYSRPGESQVIFMARDSMRSKDIPELFYQVRKKVGDIRATLPDGVVGPFFNDEFGDTFGNIYALTGEGFDYAILKDYADRIQLELQRVADVGKVELIGLQDEKVWIEIDNARLATLGIPLQAVQQALEGQNAVVPAGFYETASERVQLRVDGPFRTLEEIRAFPIRANGRTIRLQDVATVTRGFADPAAPRMRFMGQDAIGIAVAMRDGGHILRLGEALEAEFARLQEQLPAGMQLRKVSDQPEAVRDSVGEFVRVLAEAVTIVLLVSFFSLGFRTGLVVAVSIPLVLAMTFAVMNYFGIGLHKISLGALVLAHLGRRWQAPLHQLRDTLERAARGDTQARARLERHDEWGALGAALDRVLDERGQRLERIAHENESLNRSVVGLLHTVFQMSNKDLTARAEVTEDIIGTLSASINQLGEETSRTLHEVQDIADQVRSACPSSAWRLGASPPTTSSRICAAPIW